MTIVQHLIVDEYGCFLSKHSERLQVIQNGEVKTQAPLLYLESVTIANPGVSLSAEVVRECTERGIPIHFIGGTGIPYASLYSSGLTGTVLTRRAQIEAYNNIRGLRLPLASVRGKLQNQSNLLKYMAKYRKENDPDLYQELTLCAAEILDNLIKLEEICQQIEIEDKKMDIETLRAEIMGLEGKAGERYWSAVRQVLPTKYKFPGRVGRGAPDPINSCLNYGYGILYGACERSLVLAGLDPYAGFLHVDRPGKPSLTLDFIEEFRQSVVDRTIIGLANKNAVFEQDEKNMLSQTTRRTVAEKVLARLDADVNFEGKNHTLRSVIQMQARHMATFLRGERDSYQSYTLDW